MIIQTRRSLWPAGTDWPKASGVGAAAFSKTLDAKMMYAPPKDDPPILLQILLFFRQLQNMVYVKTQK